MVGKPKPTKNSMSSDSDSNEEVEKPNESENDESSEDSSSSEQEAEEGAEAPKQEKGSESGSDSEEDDEDQEEESTTFAEEGLRVADLQGIWRHSLVGANITVRGPHVTFPDSTVYTLSEQNRTCELDGWTAIVNKSDKNIIVWSKPDEKNVKWDFESPLEDLEVPEPEVDASNIITSKRTRKAIVGGYKELNKKLDEEKKAPTSQPSIYDSDEEERPRKKSKVSLPRSKEAASSSSSSSIPLKLAVVAPASAAEVKNLSERLSLVPSITTPEIHSALAALSKYKMTLPVLQSSGVGKAVNLLRKHADEEVGRKATVLIMDWKKLAAGN
jgi:hypothetical protein